MTPYRTPILRSEQHVYQTGDTHLSEGWLFTWPWLAIPIRMSLARIS